MDRPEVVCLCGSTRFYEAFQEWNYRLTMEGKIVLSIAFYPHVQEKAHGEEVGCTPEQKKILDELHLRRIDLADSIFVINVGGYIGESTGHEIQYAERHGKPIRYLEGQGFPQVEDDEWQDLDCPCGEPTCLGCGERDETDEDFGLQSD